MGVCAGKAGTDTHLKAVHRGARRPDELRRQEMRVHEGVNGHTVRGAVCGLGVWAGIAGPDPSSRGVCVRSAERSARTHP